MDTKTFPGVPRCPTKNLGPIGSAVLTFIGYKQTNKQTNKQTDRQAKFIYRCLKYALLKYANLKNVSKNILLKLNRIEHFDQKVSFFKYSLISTKNIS